MRKAGHDFRYIAALEHHRDGTPHWHLLLVEQTKAILYDHIWPNYWDGFVHAKIADDRHCWYVAKYLVKQTRGRIRASRAWGSNPARRKDGELSRLRECEEVAGGKPAQDQEERATASSAI